MGCLIHFDKSQYFFLLSLIRPGRRPSAQYINKVVKGGENLGLETICKIEKALGINLISVPQFESNQLLVKGNSSVAANINRNNAQPIGSEKHTYHNKSKYQPEKETFAENEMHFA